MSNVPQELIEEARKRGIVPGAVIACGVDAEHGTVRDEKEWYYSKFHNAFHVGVDRKGRTLYGYGHNKQWATVITPAPSKEEEGLKEGDAVECGSAMRAAIIELAKQLGITSTDVDPRYPMVVYEQDRIDLCFHSYKGIQKRIAPESFIAKMRITAAMPKPEPPIKIDGHEVKYEAGQIKVGCQTIPNATVRAIAEKLID